MPVTREQFERFVQERTYLQNVSPRTVEIYQAAWKKWEQFGLDSVAFVAGMRTSGKSAIGCNIYIRALNAFFHWAGEKTIPKLKAEEKIPPTFSLPDVQKLLKFKPSQRYARGFNAPQQRLRSAKPVICRLGIDSDPPLDRDSVDAEPRRVSS